MARLITARRVTITHPSTLLQNIPAPVSDPGAGTLGGSPRRLWPGPGSEVWPQDTRLSVHGITRQSALEKKKRSSHHHHFDKLTFVNCWKQAGVCALTHCSSGRLTAVSWWTGYETWCRNHHCPASWSCNVWRSGLWCCHSPALTDSTPLFTSRDNRQTDGDRRRQVRSIGAGASQSVWQLLSGFS